MAGEKDVTTQEKTELQELAEETETSEESSTEKTAESETGAVEKTQEADEEVKDDGSPIPFERFSKVNTQKNEFKTKAEELEEELEEMRETYNDPDILRAVYKKQGLTEEAINARLKEAGHEVKEKEITEDEERRSEEKTQKLTDEFIAEIEKIVVAKETNQFNHVTLCYHHYYILASPSLWTR